MKWKTSTFFEKREKDRGIHNSITFLFHSSSFNKHLVSRNNCKIVINIHTIKELQFSMYMNVYVREYFNNDSILILLVSGLRKLT
jgi:hypothetical protein